MEIDLAPPYRRRWMATERPAEVLHGRRDEREVLDRLLEAVRDGQSRVLVMTGEPGVGKTALLESAIGSASAFRVVRAVGVESEMELAFAAAAAVVRADARSAGTAPCPSAGRARRGVRADRRGTRRIGFWSGWPC